MRPMRFRRILVSLPVSLACLLMAGTVFALGTGQRAPEIGLRDLHGQTIQIGRLRGKVVLVDFWASWCEPCHHAMPEVNAIYQHYRNRGFVAVGVSVDRDVGHARDFAQHVGATFPIVDDIQHQVAGRYAPPRMPTSFLIDRRGIVRKIFEGYRQGDAQRIDQAVRSLL